MKKLILFNIVLLFLVLCAHPVFAAAYSTTVPNLGTSGIFDYGVSISSVTNITRITSIQVQPLLQDASWGVSGSSTAVNLNNYTTNTTEATGTIGFSGSPGAYIITINFSTPVTFTGTGRKNLKLFYDKSVLVFAWNSWPSCYVGTNDPTDPNLPDGAFIGPYIANNGGGPIQVSGNHMTFTEDINPPPPGSANLTFFIGDGPDQTGIGGAQVIIDGSPYSNPIYNGYTNSSGYYTITDVISGHYTATFSALGYLTSSQLINAISDQNINVYLVPVNWSPTYPVPAGYEPVNFHISDVSTGYTVPATVTIKRNGTQYATGYVQLSSGYAALYLDQSVTFTADITYDNYYPYHSSFTTFGNTTPIDYYISMYPINIYNSTTPTPIPSATSSYNVTLISTLSPAQRASKVGAATDIWYLNVDFLSQLFFICVVMGALGLMSKGMGGGGSGRRRR